jgi:hypothetical protein
LNMSQGVILFPSIHYALRAEKLLKEKGIPYKLVPVPRQLSSDCGVGLRFSWEEKEEIEAALKKAGVKKDGIYRLEQNTARGSRG